MGFPVDGTGSSAEFGSLGSIAVATDGTVFVTDSGYLRKVTPAGVVTTVAVTDSSTGTVSNKLYLGGLALDPSGNLYASCGYAIKKITPDGVMSNLAGGTTFGSNDGTGEVATFGMDLSLATDLSGNVYVRDSDTNKVRKITPDGVVTTLAGSGVAGCADGIGAAASFNFGNGNNGIAVDHNGNVYVADQYNGGNIRKITQDGVVTTLAYGVGSGIVADNNGNLYVISGNSIQTMTADNKVSTLPLQGESISVSFNIGIDGSGNLYVPRTWPGIASEVIKITLD